MVFHRFLIGPAIGVLSTGVLYEGFFTSSPQMILGDLNVANRTTFLLAGFLVHSYLNSGYYNLPTKILEEWHTKTLPLLWALPLSRIPYLLGTTGVDCLRAGLLTSLSILILSTGQSHSAIPLLWTLVLFFGLFWFGTVLGALRSICLLTHQGKSDLLDYLYLGLLFFSCLYIPKGLLPSVLHPLIDFNPIYHGVSALRVVFEGNTPPPLSLAILFVGLVSVTAILMFVWNHSEDRVMERSL